MFKKTFRLTLAAAAMAGVSLSMGAFANDNAYKAGVDYKIIKDQRPAQREVREYFSLYCPHCYAWEPYMGEVKTNLPKGVAFNRSHVDFLGMLENDVQTELTKAYVAMLQDEREGAFIDFMFKRIHKEGKRPLSVEDIHQAVTEFDPAITSPSNVLNAQSVLMEQSAMQADHNYLQEKGMLLGVPTLVVNNRYVIVSKELDKKDPIADLINLITYLNESGE